MPNEIKVIELSSARKFIESNWPNDPLLRQIGINLLESLPEADTVDLTLQKLIKTLEAEYAKASKLEHIRNPAAYALYQVWKLADRGGKV